MTAERPGGTEPVRRNRIHSGIILLCCMSCCVPVLAQRNPQQAGNPSSPSHNEPFELGKENADRVAASAPQIREILVKEPGLLVELKRMVAKEATNYGQMIDDAALTDQAIFDRLDDDIPFRSVATRLLQRYGYLLPSVNPDSEYGKQQDLVLKERARRLVQIEAQEDAQSLNPKIEDQQGDGLLRAKSCDQHSGQDCEETAPRRRSNRPEPDGNPPDKTDFPSGPLPGIPAMPNPMMRAGMPGGGLDSSSPGADQQNDSLRLASLARSRDSFSQQPFAGGMEDLAGALTSGADSGEPPSTGSDAHPSSSRESERNSRAASVNGSSKAQESGRDSRESPDGVVVHKNNPYADVPSLYDLYVQVPGRDRAPERFGIDILTSVLGDSRAIPMDLPVGPDYVVGPGDGLAINLWGGMSQRMVRTVDREGRILLPESGPLLVSGRSLGEVQMTVQEVLRTQYRDISADVSLSRLRTVRVYVVGEVANPGAYDISSLSTPLNALVAAGGITQRGSLRALKHFRGKQLVEVVDAYDLLLRGVSSSLQRLENGDSLLVPQAGAQVTVEGMVRRPAIYELHDERALQDVLELAGGVLPAAALQHVEVERIVAHEKRTMFSLDLSASADINSAAVQLANFRVQDGDRIHIFPIAPYNDQAIYLQGHVLRPGRYSYRDGMKLGDLISSYSDLLPEPAGTYAEIIRLNPPDFRPSVENFDLAAALANPAMGPNLKPLDTVRIFSKYDFEPAPDVWVGGEVRAPGKYRTSGRAHLRDAIFLAGGPAPDAALDSAQLFRTSKDGTIQIISLKLDEALAGNPAADIALQPRDRVILHRNPAKVDPPTVYVRGEVAKPGRYPLTTNMHVEDLVRVAGGLKRSADSDSANLTHHPESQPAGAAPENIPVNLSAVLAGQSTGNRLLGDGDVLTVPQNPGWNDIGATVTVRGEVMRPGSYGIRPGERLSSVLAQAGGFTPQAYPYGAVLTRREVREQEMKSQEELIYRVQAEETLLKALPEGDQDQKNAKLTAIAQTETTLTQLQANPPIGRVVIHAPADLKTFAGSESDPVLRNGDTLLIPKKANYVLVSGQVFHPTAIGFVPNRSAKWYLSQSGGLTQLADKKAAFVIRANGSVLAAKNNSGWFGGDPLDAVLLPGDSIVVPEKAPRVGSRNWPTILQAAQVASSVALAVAYIHP